MLSVDPENPSNEDVVAAALTILNRDHPDAWPGAVEQLVLERLHDRQKAVVKDIDDGNRFIAMCTGRRAGKTTLLASLIIKYLLRAGHNQTVLFVASTLQKGRDLIWADLKLMVERYALPWNMREHIGTITTPKNARFCIVGLSTKGKAEAPRGADVIAALIDEAQDATHLLTPLLTAIGPALVARGGVLVLSGTPGYQPAGTWYEIAEHGRAGFKPHHFTILDNPMLPRDSAVILEEELERNKWTRETPEFLREYMGRWVPDDSMMVFSFDAEIHSRLELPPDFGPSWLIALAMDLGYNDHSAWCVLALDPQTQRKIVLHAESHPRLFSDRAVEITREIITKYKIKRVVCDPSAGGLGFYEAFNAQHGKELGVVVSGAKKVDKSGRVALVNSELRAGRLSIMRPSADALATELQSLRYMNRDTCSFLTSTKIRDDCTDCLMYAMAELAWVVARPAAAESAKMDAIEALFSKASRQQDVLDDLR